MRSVLAAAVLLLLLGAPRAFATSPAAAVAERAPDERPRSGYRESSGKSEVLKEGDLRVSIRTGLLKPPRGYTPLEVVLQNSGPAPLQARLSFQGHYGAGTRVTERLVEVGPRQRVVAWLPVPATLPAGNVEVQVLGLPRVVQPVYLDHAQYGAVLVLGTTDDFEAGTGLQEAEENQEPLFAARFLEEREAPRELASYVGYPVVLVSDVAAVPADVWAILEAYAVSGGRLVLTRPPRDLGERLPLLAAGDTRSEVLYGFGHVRRCGQPAECAQAVTSLLAEATSGPVSPIGPPPRWERGNTLQGGELPLLESARAPVGRFLMLIFAFALAVGPGGLVLARRRGPVAVLVAVPVVSLITCVALIAWSVLVDGFAVHAARYSLTWLDGQRSRAVTLGVAAWYANLSPGEVKFPASSALLPPDEQDESLVDLDWTNGLTVTRGFLPPRTYREWGEVAVLPTRARLVLRDEGGTVRVQNALGARVEKGYLRRGGAHYRLPALEDGAEAVLDAPVPEAELPHPVGDLLQDMGPTLDERLVRGNPGFQSDLPDGGFVVRVGGPGLAPSAALPVELEAGVHVVRGQVEEVRP
ncbi:hypothetical protein [Myxococcus sp. RHSTA-1-4]|uniref:hypothetical protein n=1 Tax=Myxococcus sp. RHSTA-1-4 TaxID=2874601 RepID=UPI001CC0142F|nr:hypothetical protein [Myxococcus sp. RHSTA-1-4]